MLPEDKQFTDNYDKTKIKIKKTHLFYAYNNVYVGGKKGNN